jgi:DNA-binding GntR family transcriptional regulator
MTMPSKPLTQSEPVTEPKIAKRSKTMTTHALCDWIRDGIRGGRYVPGQRLVEADITAETGAVRSRVREAFQRLESEGLIAIEAFRGASVKRLTTDEVHQIYQARMVLEGLAAGAFTRHATPEERARLVELQAAMDQDTGKGHHERFAQLNSEWHRLIITGSRNRYIAQFLKTLTIPVYRLLFTTFYKSDRIDAANADHQAITAAICAGDAPEAERLMRQHIEHGLKALSEFKNQISG